MVAEEVVAVVAMVEAEVDHQQAGSWTGGEGVTGLHM